MAIRTKPEPLSEEEVVARAALVDHLRDCPVAGTDDPEVASRVEVYTVHALHLNEAKDVKPGDQTAAHCMECGAIRYGV